MISAAQKRRRAKKDHIRYMNRTQKQIIEVRERQRGYRCNLSPTQVCARKTYAKKWRRNRTPRQKKRDRALAQARNLRYARSAKGLIVAARKRAIFKKLKFCLQEKDIAPLPVICPVFGIPLDWRDKYHAPSIDRVDNSQGYVLGNTTVISFRANQRKSDMSLDDLLALGKWAAVMKRRRSVS